jgi:hypothetical protein
VTTERAVDPDQTAADERAGPNAEVPVAAWHESGHATVARALGWTVRLVQVEGTRGACRARHDKVPEPWAEVLTIAVAGLLGEGMANHGGTRVSSALLPFAEPDVTARDVLARWEGQGVDLDYRQAVWAVAEALGPGASAFDALVSILDAEWLVVDILTENYDQWVETARTLAACGEAEG